MENPKMLLVTLTPEINQPLVDAFNKVEPGYAQLINYNELTVTPEGEIIHDKQPLPKANIYWQVIWKANSVGKSHHIRDALLKAGYSFINPPHLRSIVGDKWTTFNAMEKANIPTIPTRLIQIGESFASTEIIKPRHGTMGEHFYTYDDYESVPEGLADQWICQPFIPNHDKWLRVLIVGGEAVAAYERHPQPGMKVNNRAQGAIMHIIALDEVPEEAIRLSIKATQTVGLTFCGVDITDLPHQIVELNSSPTIPQYCFETFASQLIKIL